MMRMFLVALLAGVVVVSTGCGCGTGRSGGDAANGKTDQAAADPNAAVKASHSGEERVTYAASSKWMAGHPVPDGEQCPEAPTDSDYVKFTYAGDRLVRQEGFDVSGQPMRLDMDGVRREWMYASHGGVLVEAVYDAAGAMARCEEFRYDDQGRCARRTLCEYDTTVNESVYTYNADGLTRTNRMEIFGPDGERISVLSETERWNPATETWEIEVDEEF